ncbi:MAG: hypothetical protein R3F59_01620 [Myxococcota bacterium]
MAEGLFLQARQEVLTGIAETSHPEDAVGLESLLYGWGFGAERIRAFNEGAATRSGSSARVDNDFQTLRNKMRPARRSTTCSPARSTIGWRPDPRAVPDLSVLLDGDAIQVACGAIPEGYVAPNDEFVQSVPWAGGAPDIAPDDGAPDGSAPDEATDDGTDGAQQTPRPRRRFPLFGGGRNDDDGSAEQPKPRGGGLFGRKRDEGPQLVEFADVTIDDRLHAATLEAVIAGFDRRKELYDLLPNRPDLYEPEVLYWHQDFRVLLAMRYVASMAKDYGVQTQIREVLSMPLGANEITLEEATSLYGGIVTGTAYSFTGSTPKGDARPLLTSTSLIQEIRDVDGRVLYSAEPEPTQVADPSIGAMTADILHNVVLHGTGRRAASAIQQDAHPVPVGGKTGTTNDFRNAAFVGYVPLAADDGFHVPGGYIVGAYVGYDDNRSMSNGRIKLAGASGALPAWIGTAQGLAESHLLGDAAPTVEVTGEGWPLVAVAGLSEVPVEEHTGVPLPEGTAQVLTRASEAAPEVELPHLQRPPRIAPGTEAALPEGAPPPPPAPDDLDLGAPEDGFQGDEL